MGNRPWSGWRPLDTREAWQAASREAAWKEAETGEGREAEAISNQLSDERSGPWRALRRRRAGTLALGAWIRSSRSQALPGNAPPARLPPGPLKNCTWPAFWVSCQSLLLIPPRARISFSGLVRMHDIPRRFIFAPPSPLLLWPILASLRKDRECVCQTHPRGSAVWDGPVGSKQRGVAVRIGPSPRKGETFGRRGAGHNHPSQTHHHLVFMPSGAAQKSERRVPQCGA